MPHKDTPTANIPHINKQIPEIPFAKKNSAKIRVIGTDAYACFLLKYNWLLDLTFYNYTITLRLLATVVYTRKNL